MVHEGFPYLHGFSPEEQKRLRHQARFAEQIIYQDVNFSDVSNILEVGCGVGAQTEILLRRFPDLHITGIDLNEAQLGAARASMEQNSLAKGRTEIKKMDASNMEFKSASFDGAFLCWVLEHVPAPDKVLGEVRRVLRPGSRIYVTEVMNHSFFLDPYSPNVWKYWMSFNDFQHENAGDPFVGAKLGNLLTSQGYREVRTEVKTWHYDNRCPQKRKEQLDYWHDLLMSGKDTLLAAGVIDEKTVKEAQKELKAVAANPNAVFFYSFMQAQAVVL